MQRYGFRWILAVAAFWMLAGGCGHGTDRGVKAAKQLRSPFAAAREVGWIDDPRLTECSGLDASTARDDLLWALNDSGNGPFLYALGTDGRSFGRVRVAKAKNRDWEDLATFKWKGRSMILIADAGDNFQRRYTHDLYVVAEPAFNGRPFDDSAVSTVAWHMVFTYPDHGHDVEAVGVDATAGTVLVLTKRDVPPRLFELPLVPPATQGPLMAKEIARCDGIPRPSGEEVLLPFGALHSQPTGLDVSADGRWAVVLTYKQAYLFERRRGESWGRVFGTVPEVIALPPPDLTGDLRQREAICFSMDEKALFVTSEGKGAGFYRLDRQ